MLSHFVLLLLDFMSLPICQKQRRVDGNSHQFLIITDCVIYVKFQMMSFTSFLNVNYYKRYQYTRPSMNKLLQLLSNENKAHTRNLSVIIKKGLNIKQNAITHKPGVLKLMFYSFKLNFSNTKIQNTVCIWCAVFASWVPLHV